MSVKILFMGTPAHLVVQPIDGTVLCIVNGHTVRLEDQLTGYVTF